MRCEFCAVVHGAVYVTSVLTARVGITYITCIHRGKHFEFHKIIYRLANPTCCCNVLRLGWLET